MCGWHRLTPLVSSLILMLLERFMRKMPVIDGRKVACWPCIRGHRSGSCNHAGTRTMVPVRRPGRPLSSCPHLPGTLCDCRYQTADPATGTPEPQAGGSSTDASLAVIQQPFSPEVPDWPATSPAADHYSQSVQSFPSADAQQTQYGHTVHPLSLADFELLTAPDMQHTASTSTRSHDAQVQYSDWAYTTPSDSRLVWHDTYSHTVVADPSRTIPQEPSATDSGQGGGWWTSPPTADSLYSLHDMTHMSAEMHQYVEGGHHMLLEEGLEEEERHGEQEF
ncbi:hypothetical protein QBC35DRAFT_468039 [Podospora australis]|uniref:Copper-fist domain-containing protein n=1 Tax=Podospora australis TaxID=1536484 RepID=A0AAN6WJF8_9PEZI|nr:hypothetical protein QBC35DRAFT_468039 [Podospora australis]